MGLYVFSLPNSQWLREHIALSYYHHQIGSMNYYPLFRVRSWNNGMRCTSLYILIMIIQSMGCPVLICGVRPVSKFIPFELWAIAFYYGKLSNSFVRCLITSSAHIAKATVASHFCWNVLITKKTALDRKQFVALLFMDLSKAFDCLPHGLMISKLHAYGVSTPACELLFTYLHGRKQRVKISTSRSSWTTLSKGVPQGSGDGRNAIDWVTKNGMQANPDKFHFISLSLSPLEKQVLELRDGTTLISEAAVSVLGVTIDDNLSFNEHINVCCTKAARQLNALARVAKYLDVRSRRTIYNSFVNE